MYETIKWLLPLVLTAIVSGWTIKRHRSKNNINGDRKIEVDGDNNNTKIVNSNNVNSNNVTMKLSGVNLSDAEKSSVKNHYSQLFDDDKENWRGDYKRIGFTPADQNERDIFISLKHKGIFKNKTHWIFGFTDYGVKIAANLD